MQRSREAETREAEAVRADVAAVAEARTAE